MFNKDLYSNKLSNNNKQQHNLLFNKLFNNNPKLEKEVSLLKVFNLFLKQSKLLLKKLNKKLFNKMLMSLIWLDHKSSLLSNNKVMFNIFLNKLKLYLTKLLMFNNNNLYTLLKDL